MATKDPNISLLTLPLRHNIHNYYCKFDSVIVCYLILLTLCEIVPYFRSLRKTFLQL